VSDIGSRAAPAASAAPAADTAVAGAASAVAAGASVAGPRLRLGTRGSALALAQSGTIAGALRGLGATVELVTIRTAGDSRAPTAVWGEGAFVTALEAALLEGLIDVAVHSAKDVPTEQDPRLCIAAFPSREDPRDALVSLDASMTLDTLPPGARVGTDSPRRVAFLVARRPDLRPHPLHGNVDTRLRRLADGETDALILAVAGLTRLGLAGRITQSIPANILPPAPGQGALAVQCRADDSIVRPLLERLDDVATRTAVEAERAFLAASGGGCRAPLGALGMVRDGTLELLVGAADPADVRVGDAPPTAAAELPGTTFTAARPTPGPVRVAWGRRTGPASEGPVLAEALAREIAATIDRRAVSRSGAAGQVVTAPLAAQRAGARRPRILVTRDAERAGPLVEALRDRGLDPVGVPTIAIETGRPGGPLDEAMPAAASYAWVAVTSPTGARALVEAAARTGADLGAARIAAVGRATSAIVEQAGARPTFVPSVASAAGLAEELPVLSGDRVLLVRGNLADERLGVRLRARGAAVDEVVAYRTVEAPAQSARAARAAFRDGLDGLVFTSGSTVRGLLALLDELGRGAAVELPAFCIGPSTASVARDAGFITVHEAAEPEPEALADLVRAGMAGPAPAQILVAPGSTRAPAASERA
jgi:hydroxymethylbilane synthase